MEPDINTHSPIITNVKDVVVLACFAYVAITATKGLYNLAVDWKNVAKNRVERYLEIE